MFAMGGLHAGALGVVWIYVQADFDLTLSALGVLVTVATLGRVLTSAASGPLINRFGIAWVLITGIGVTGASLLVFAAAPVWIIVLLAAFISGVGSGVMASGINAFAAVNFSARQMNWLHGSFGIGSTIGPLGRHNAGDRSWPGLALGIRFVRCHARPHFAWFHPDP